jgi:ABC-2 type transport system permease protein
VKSLFRTLTISRKELLEFVSTPLLWITETIFVILAGYFFYLGMLYYNEMSMEWLANPVLQKESLNPTSVLIPPIFSNYALLLLFFVPLLTMSTFSSEKKEGTLELLFTLPVRDIELVFGKWLGVSIMILFLFIPLWIFPFIAQYFKLFLSFETYAAGFLGLVLLAFFFSSVGLFVSSLFESQTASAVMGVGLLVILWTLESAHIFQLKLGGGFLSAFSIQKYLQPFLRGIISTENILFFVLATIFFLFLTFRALEKRSFRNPL